jgi:flagellar export protein FliJ
MKAFEFRLQRILDFRLQQAEVERAGLQKLLAQLRQLDDEAHNLQNQILDARQDAERRPSLTGGDFLALAQFEGFVVRRTTFIDSQRQQLQPLIERQRAVTIEAERNVKLIERLRERKLREWAAARDKELDELAADSHLARLSGARIADVSRSN